MKNMNACSSAGGSRQSKAERISEPNSRRREKFEELWLLEEETGTINELEVNTHLTYKGYFNAERSDISWLWAGGSVYNWFYIDAPCSR